MRVDVGGFGGGGMLIWVGGVGVDFVAGVVILLFEESSSRENIGTSCFGWTAVDLGVLSSPSSDS